MKHNSDEIVGKYDMKTDNLRKYIKLVLDTYDDVNELGLHKGWINRSSIHESAVEPYGLTERETWMLFANVDYDYRWCGYNIDRLVDVYDNILQKLSNEKKKNYEIVDGEVCDTGYYDCKMRFHVKTLRELNEYFNKNNNTINKGN